MASDTRRTVALLGAGALAAAAAFAWWSQPSAPAHDGPNVLFIVWDTTRADRLSLYGYERDTTPRLTEFAKQAVVFDRAVSPAMWTPPSHSSMFTGYAPTHHGVEATNKWLDHHHVTLAEWLGEHGYDTYAFSANPYVAPTTNITQGFSVTDNTFAGRWKKAARKATKQKLIDDDASSDISPKWKPQAGQRASGTAHAYKDAAPVAHEALMEWLSARPDTDRPWFAFLNMMEAHIPRVPSIESRKALLTPDQIRLGLATDVAQINLLAHTFGKKSYTPEEIDAINGVYDAAIRDMDAATGDLLDDLRDRGMLENTIVVLTADHGENLGDHGMFGHKYNVYDTLLRVPLVISWPEKLEARRVDFPVSNLNLFTTLLSLVGLEAPPTQPDSHGSLLDLTSANPVFAELNETTPISIKRIADLYGLSDASKYVRTFKAVEAGGWKFIRSSDGAHELYHLPSDPGELTNRIATDAGEVPALDKLLTDWLASVPAYDPSKQVESDKHHPKLDAATKDMLKELGYLDAGEGKAPAADEEALPDDL